MQPHPRIRKTIKWGGLVLTVLLVGVWVGSQWYNVRWYDTRGFGVGVRDGRVRWVTFRPTLFGRDYRPGFLFERISNQWPRALFFSSSHAKYVSVPIWWAWVGTSLLTASAWLRDARLGTPKQPGKCPSCDYDRTGLASAGAVCPECGAGAPGGAAQQ